MQPSDVPGEWIFAHFPERYEDSDAVPPGDALKLFFG